MKEYPSKSELINLFIYNEETGDLIWKTRGEEYFKSKRGHAIWNSRYTGCIAGSVGTHGSNSSKKSYVKVSINKSMFYAHRIIYIIFNGSIDGDLEIDHINGNGLDNKIENLRLVSRVENLKNRRRCSINSSGFNGVSFDKKSKKWHSYINTKNRRYNLGLFDDISEAIRAREEANKMKNFHINHGQNRDL